MRRRDLVAMGFGGAALTTAVLAIGGAPRWSQAIVALLVGSALASQFRSIRIFSRPPTVVVVLGIALGLTLLQLIPLPNSVISQLAPIGSSLRTDGATIVGTSPWSALSLDAPGTLRAAAFLLILLGVAILAVRLSVSESGRYLLLASVAGIAGLTAAIVGIHSLFGLTSLYGVYTPAQATPSLLGPLLNENHLGCLMAIGAVTAMGLSMYRRQRTSVRVMWVIVLGACGATTLATLSRGATVALLGGAGVAIGTLIGQRFFTPSDVPQRRRRHMLTRSLPVVVVITCAIVVVLYASAGGVSAQLAHTTVDEIHAPRTKFAAWRSATTLIEESPWVGVGRGAFEPSFTRVHAASAISTFSHLENEYIQAVVDWGIPGAALLALAGLWLAMSALRRWRDGPLAAGALGALAVVALQSNVDFAVEMLGVAIPIVVVIATLTYVPLKEAPERTLRVRGLRVGHIVALGASVLVLLSDATMSVAEDHQRISSHSALTLSDLRPSLQRHPLDYFGYATAAQVMIRNKDPHAVETLNHALLLHPSHPGLHLLAAHLLYDGGHLDQSAIEYASAMRGEVHQHVLLKEIVTRFPDAQRAASAIPADDPRLDIVLASLADLHRNDVAVDWLIRVLAQRPNNTRACEAIYSLAIQQADSQMTALAARTCPRYDIGRDTRLSLARALQGKAADAAILILLNDVESWSGRVDDKVAAWLALCDAYTNLKRWDDARRCLRRLDGAGLVPATVTAISSRLQTIREAQAAEAPR